MKVSVIIPTYRRETLLCQTIDDVLKQDYPSFEILVLDQSESHEYETEHYLNSIQNRIRYYRLSKPNVVSACNFGVKKSKGDILLFLDDDIKIPNSHLIANHVKNYDDPEIGGVAGKILDSSNPIDSIYDPKSYNWKWGFLSARCDHNVRTEVITAQGANMSFRKNIIVTLNGFDENFTGNAFRWETDLCYRLRKSGKKILFEPEAIVLHYYNSVGGNENRHLFGKKNESHSWYYHFFKNTFYFYLKNIGILHSLPKHIWNVYRGHVFNKNYIREGCHFLKQRHIAFYHGLRDGVFCYLSQTKHQHQD